MEKLPENQMVVNQPSLLKAVAIAFPEGKVNAFVPDNFLKIKVKDIDVTQFKNLKSIAGMFKQEISIEVSGSSMVITFTDIADQEKEGGNHGE